MAFYLAGLRFAITCGFRRYVFATDLIQLIIDQLVASARRRSSFKGVLVIR
ncbi:MAG TPA: hypothetical protein VLA93_00490 [Pyrinomonadaceae bacterium]|nr:hypothetical protein [Pyrinomonadaceae bacterium]